MTRSMWRRSTSARGTSSEGIVGRYEDGLSVLTRELLKERLREQQHVRASRAKRRHGDLHHVDPVVGIVPEGPFLDARKEDLDGSP